MKVEEKLLSSLVSRETFEAGLTLRNVMVYGKYLDGAINAISALEPIIMSAVKGSEKVYMRAILDLLLSGKMNMDAFLLGNHEIGFRNHERKGNRLIKCEAYFVE